jgi:hypothetical protein
MGLKGREEVGPQSDTAACSEGPAGGHTPGADIGTGRDAEAHS